MTAHDGNEKIRLSNKAVISKAQLRQMIELRKKGMSPDKVALRLGVTATTVNLATKGVVFAVNWLGCTPVDHAEISKAAAENTTYAAVARAVNLSPKQVKEYFSRYKLRLKKADNGFLDTPPHRPDYARMMPELERAVRMGLSEGYTQKDVGRILGISHHMVAKVAKKHNISSDRRICSRQYDPAFDGQPSIIARRWKNARGPAGGRKMPEHIVVKGPENFQEIAKPLRRRGYVVYPLDNDKENGWFKVGTRDVRWKELCRLSKKAQMELEGRK